MQNQYSLTYREEEREMNAYCKFAGIGLIPWGPLNRGQLARPLSAQSTTREESMKHLVPERRIPEWEKEIVRRVEKVAKEKGWSMAQVSLAWINDKVTSPIVGFSSVSNLLFYFYVFHVLILHQIKRLEEAIIPGYKLTDEEIKFLEEAYQPQAIRGHQ
jgi:aryl-alcohol dehydrogenase-like predicted oxidoreductase